MAAIAFSACTVINKADSGHAPFVTGGPAVTAAERDTARFIKLRVAATGSDTVTLPSTFGRVIDFAVRTVDNTDNADVLYNPTLNRFTITTGAPQSVDIWIWFR